jgi:hypothetical protein
MSAPAISSIDEESLILALLIGLLLVRRAYAQYRGTPLSTGRLLGYAVMYPVLFALIIGSESFPIVPYWSIVADVAAAAVGAALALDYVGRRVTIYQEGGRWRFRLGLLVPVVYVVMFVGRLLLELAIGINPYAPTSTALPAGTLAILEVVDVLYGFSTGLAIGRNLGVYRAWQRAASGESAPPLRSEPS